MRVLLSYPFKRKKIIMKNFTFENPVKIVFGKDTIAQLPQLLSKNEKIMLTFGGGSAKKNGVYDQVVKALEGYDYTEFWGIEANPRFETLMKGVEAARKENVTFLLAIGGGSVIDGTKFISKAIKYNGDEYELLTNRKIITEYTPLATIVTLAATGSEMNNGAVITVERTHEKLVMSGDFPKFSILDPEILYSLPKFQIACGIIDTFIHTLEQYLTKTGQSRLMDRWAEGILQSLVEIAPELMKPEPSYDAMADFMLSANMALNGFISMGIEEDWVTHMIGHEITAYTNLTHGVTLAIVMPRVMEVLKEEKGDKILQYGERVWGITSGTLEERIHNTIACTREFFESLDIRTSLSGNDIPESVSGKIVERWRSRKWKLGENRNVDADLVRIILDKCK